MAVRVTVPHVLVVAGTDSSGGAGIARDVETLAALGVRACLAVTAVTAQTDRLVERVEPMPARLVESQMRTALAGGLVRAVKLGMLAKTETAEAVGRVLAEHPDLPVVIDPVLVSTSGRLLIEDDAVSAYEGLYGRAALITPNLPELAVLAGSAEAGTEAEAASQALVLVQRGARAVLVKGGHARTEEAADLLVTAGGITRHAMPRIDVSMRGTGCALASGIAAQLALGRPLSASVWAAKDLVFQRLSGVRSSREEG